MRLSWIALALLLLAARAGAEEPPSPNAVARTAPAERPPDVVASLLSGAATAIAPLAVGGALFASRDYVPTRQAGLFIAFTGLTAAPFVSHAVAHEWRRALWFTLAPAVGSIVAASLMEAHPQLFDHDHPPIRVAFGAAVSVAVLGAIVGLADSAGAADRWRRRHPVVAGRF